MKNNNKTKIGMVLLIGVMLLSFMSALSVSTTYMEKINGVKTFEVYQDNSEDFQVVLQNGGADSPVNVKVEILEGSDVIELMDNSDIYLVNPGDKVPVNFRVVAPKGANIGDTFPVRLAFSSSEVGDGALAFGTAIEQSFNVQLVEMPVYATEGEEKEAGNIVLFVSLGILVLLVVLIIIIKVKKNGNEPQVKPTKKKTSAKKK